MMTLEELIKQWWDDANYYAMCEQHHETTREGKEEYRVKRILTARHRGQLEAVVRAMKTDTTTPLPSERKA